jgi:hypothetical protein
MRLIPLVLLATVFYNNPELLSTDLAHTSVGTVLLVGFLIVVSIVK